MEFLSSLRKRLNQDQEEEEENDGIRSSAERNDVAVVGPEERRRRRFERPPEDDCCPICFGGFVFPFRGHCGHWYCGGCIMQYWDYGAPLEPCKCPMCSQMITRLIPDKSVSCCQDGELLEKIKNYNLIFIGGTCGLFVKVFQFPLLMRRVFGEIVDLDGDFFLYNKMRCFAIILGILYCALPWNFLPRVWPLSSPRTFEMFAELLFFTLRIVGYDLRWHRGRQARQDMR